MMTTELTVLTDEDIIEQFVAHSQGLCAKDFTELVRTIEKYIMATDEVKQWREDTKRLNYIEQQFGCRITAFEDDTWAFETDITISVANELREAIDLNIEHTD